MKIITLMIKIYQIIFSPLFGRSCRFYPSCSNFMIDAIERKGVRGIFIGIKRILRCNPFNKGGYDPIEKWIK